jgi:phosphatidylserine/phosphatidylglycerophosphate/cardiolipin synthase-like enzyme
MMGTAAALTQAPDAACSAWSDPVTVGTGQTKGFEAYFNRGIVGAQFLAKQANTSAAFKTMLQQDITKVGSPNRDFLSGPLRIALLALLKQAQTDGVEVYAALYELNDPEVIAALNALGKKCSLILGSGAFGKKGTKVVTDENADVRAQLKKDGKINVIDRLVSGNHFAHNKVIIFFDKSGAPASVWTGSTNTTVTGLCTQVNNGLLIKDPATAAAYKTRWDELKDAGNGYPASLMVQGSTPAQTSLNGAAITAWNAPCNGFVDLNDAQKYIRAAKQGVLFLMFNPGTGGGDRAESLLQDIQDLGSNGLYIHGVINQAQTPGKPTSPTEANATVQLTQNNKLLPPVSTAAITPHAITESTKTWFHQEFGFSLVMIHSKVIIVDPFGDNPVVMTGSHNMGPKASAMNDDNLVIIRNAPGLAQEYAVNILGVYGHYKWLYNAWVQGGGGAAPAAKGTKKPPVPVNPTYDGNLDSDAWQQWGEKGQNLQELQFLMGETLTQTADIPAPGNQPQASTTSAQQMARAKKTSPAKKAVAKKVPAKKVAAKQAPAKKAATQKAVAKAPAKKVPAKKAPAKKTPAKKAPEKKAIAKKAVAKKAVAKKAPAKKAVAKKAVAKKAVAKKSVAKKAVKKSAPKKAPAKKASAKKAPAKKQ